MPAVKPSNPRPCYVCQATIEGRSKYCPRCKKLIYSRHGHALRPEDLRDAYDSASDCFRCFYSGACLEENDRHSPWYLSTDHFIPGQGKVVLTGFLFNLMKSSLTGPEFITVVPELDDHLRTGTPFNKNIIQFTAWNSPDLPPGERSEHPTAAHLQSSPEKRYRPPPVAQFRPPPAAQSQLPPVMRLVICQKCRICGKPPLRYSYYCARCRFILQQHGGVVMREGALKDSYDENQDGFLCYYTGIKLETTGRFGPWHLSFEHRTPGDDKSVVVAALWVNRLKTYLTEAEFRAVIHELTGHIRNGTPFNKTVIDAVHFGQTIRKFGAGIPMGGRRF